MNTPRDDARGFAAGRQPGQRDQADATAVGSAVFLIQKMDCPTEEKLIRDRMEGMAGIDDLRFNLIQRELTVQHRLPSIARGRPEVPGDAPAR